VTLGAPIVTNDSHCRKIRLAVATQLVPKMMYTDYIDPVNNKAHGEADREAPGAGIYDEIKRLGCIRGRGRCTRNGQENWRSDRAADQARAIEQIRLSRLSLGNGAQGIAAALRELMSGDPK
jgi:hypothetical protein